MAYRPDYISIQRRNQDDANAAASSPLPYLCFVTVYDLTTAAATLRRI